MTWWLAAALMCALTLPARGSGSGDGDSAWEGEYALNRMLTYYVVNNTAANFTVTIEWINGWQQLADTPVMVRVLDPNEQVIARHLDPGLRGPGTPVPHTFNVPVAAAGAGVYQVIVTGFGGMVDFDVSPNLPWGVYGYPTLWGEDHLEEAYIFLPPNLPSLGVQCSGEVSSLRLIDSAGVTRINIAGVNAFGSCALPTGGPPQIWRLLASGPDAFGVNFGVAPIILCPDQATALAIRSSIDVLADGTICYHKFQIAAHGLLQQYRGMGASAFAVTPPDLQAGLDGWIADPVRHSLLLGQYGVVSALPATLAEQNLNPASPWFGSIHTWHNASGQERPNPWTTYDRLGMQQPAPTLNVLASVYAIDEPFNSLYRNANLRNRIIIAALQEIMMIREHGLPENTYMAFDGGEKAFMFARFTRWFPWVINDCPANVRASLITGMRFYTDQMVLTAVPPLANQWSFIMLGLRNFAKATGEQFYGDAVERQINWLLTRQMYGFGATTAGYITEGDGPDTSYSGILLHNLAWLAEDLGHAALKQALCRCYATLNCTLAPEPGGSWMGASAFAHRSPTDWRQPQWGAGVAMMGDDCPDAGVLVGHTWIPRPIPRNAEELAQAQADLQSILIYHHLGAYDDPNIGLSVLMDAPMLFFAAWERFLSSDPMTGQWPEDPGGSAFTRKLGDEFLCVRRPSYYAFVYSGRTIEEYHQPSFPSDPNVLYPRNGGGLSMFWSPGFGSSVLGQNWSAYSSNSIIATLGGQTFFENYWSVDADLQETPAQGSFHGALNGGGMSFHRQINFLDDRVVCQIGLQASQTVTYNDLWECFPFSLDKPDPITVTLHDADGHVISGNNVIAWSIVFHTSVDEAHVITFSEPRRCDVGINTSVDPYGVPRTCGRVLTSLPREWNANQARTFAWAMKVVDPCPDITHDGIVAADDLVAVILAWGPCPAPPQPCPANVEEPGQGEGQHEVNTDDLIAVLLSWGKCDEQ
jgi:hypothetical protein